MKQYSAAIWQETGQPGTEMSEMVCTGRHFVAMLLAGAASVYIQSIH